MINVRDDRNVAHIFSSFLIRHQFQPFLLLRLAFDNFYKNYQRQIIFTISTQRIQRSVEGFNAGGNSGDTGLAPLHKYSRVLLPRLF